MRTAPPDSQSTGAAPARHARWRSRLATRLRLVVVALLLVALAGGVLAYSQMQGNITRHDVAGLLGDDRPPREEPNAAPADPRAGQALNLLVLGSDSRAGANDDGSGIGGMRSDTTMIVHVAADRSRVEVVSIPRDTLVDVPDCQLPDGSTIPAREDAIFTSAFASAGKTGDVAAAAACTIRTVESLTGVYIDDFVVVDFAGFVNVVDALGGVPMYVPEPIEDPRAELSLAAGCQVLDGHDALGFARVRKSVGDGSDISRIGRQQELVGAIAREALGKHLLTDLPSLYRFLDAATSTLTTGPVIGELTTLAGLANSLRGIDPADITFVTMPFQWAGNRVVPAAEATDLWAALAADQPVAASLAGTGQAPAPDTAEAAPAPEPNADTEPVAPAADAAPDPGDGQAAVPACTK
ncbi:LCP family protein [Georgenia sp. AZ-5]|uniref:LCP family protein n=1 Tax=Georgenia sp. AZ-5 TaxID=3367526 RepID=UPI0037545887